MLDERLAAYREAWLRKPVLRAIYEDYYRQILAATPTGRVLEIGGGSGQLRDHLPGAIVSDIQFAPWLDISVDAQSLPFANNSFDGIVMLDVLHHIESARCFFEEASRVLKPGGRVVAVEPAITPVAGLFYRYCHPEAVDMAADPLQQMSHPSSRDPYDANQAIPTKLFCREQSRFEQEFPSLRVLPVRYLSLFAYPLSGGFRRWSLIVH